MLVAVLLVECAAHIGVHMLVEWLQLFPKELEVLLESRRLVQGTPERPVIRVTCRQGEKVPSIPYKTIKQLKVEGRSSSNAYFKVCKVHKAIRQDIHYIYVKPNVKPCK